MSSQDLMIDTLQGQIEASRLRIVDVIVENDNEHTTRTEYWLGEELVRWDVHVRLKKWPEGMGAVGAAFNAVKE
jgi:hypothetical protein